MEENVIIPLDTFLVQYGFDTTNFSDKDKLEALKKIREKLSVDCDVEEMKRSKNPNSITRDEYVKRINNLELLQIQAQGYILMIKCIQKETRKLKRKQYYKKVIKFFKK